MTTDPEYDRLRDAVERASDRVCKSRSSMDEAASIINLRSCLNALSNYRDKSPAPIPAGYTPIGGAACKCPGLITDGKGAYWCCQGKFGAAAQATAPEPAPLLPCPFCGGWATCSTDVTTGESDALCTSCADIPASSKAEAHAKWNTRHSPCLPDTRIPVTDEAINEFVAGYGIAWDFSQDHEAIYLRPVDIRRMLRDYPSHFTAPARVEPTPDAVRKFWRAAGYYPTDNMIQATIDAIALFSPAQPAPVQQETTDRDILAEFAEFSGEDDKPNSPWRMMHRNGAIAFARTLLAKQTPALSDEDLKYLWSLAKKEALEQFLTYARMRLVGVGK